MARRIIFGDSHIGSLWTLRDKTKGDLGSLFSENFELYWVDNGIVAFNMSYDLADGTWVRTPVLDTALDNAGVINRYSGAFGPPQADTELFFLLGSIDSHMLGHHQIWRDFCLSPGHTDRKYLPPLLLVQTIQQRIATMERVLSQIREAGYRVHILGGPPPHRSSKQIAEKRKRDFVPDAETRHLVFRAMYLALRNIASKAGVGFIDSAVWLSDADGFLRSEFESDGVHCNEAAAAAWLLGLDIMLIADRAASI